MQGILHKSDILKENHQKVLKKINLFFFRTACHPYVTRMPFVCHSYVLACHPYVPPIYSYVIRMSVVCTRMSSVCLTYLHVIRMSLVCTRMSSVCHSYILICHPYVTRMYSYVIRMSLVCTCSHTYVTRIWFYHEPGFMVKPQTIDIENRIF